MSPVHRSSLVEDPGPPGIERVVQGLALESSLDRSTARRFVSGGSTGCTDRSRQGHEPSVFSHGVSPIQSHGESPIDPLRGAAQRRSPVPPQRSKTKKTGQVLHDSCEPGRLTHHRALRCSVSRRESRGIGSLRWIRGVRGERTALCCIFRRRTFACFRLLCSATAVSLGCEYRKARSSLRIQ